jgi:hypothetical protein
LKKAKKLPRGDARAVQEGREAGMADVGGGGSKKGGKNGRGKSVFLVGQTEKLDRQLFFGPERVVKGGKEEKERREEEEEECWFHNTRSNDQPYSVSYLFFFLLSPFILFPVGHCSPNNHKT